MAKTSKPKAKSAGQNKIPAWFWEELRAKYESGDYSQRQLCDYADAKGYKISQPRISQVALSEGWIKGSILDKIRDEIADDMRRKAGDAIVDMLQNHTKQAQLIQTEVLQHSRQAIERRKADPNYVMPMTQLATMTQTLKLAQEMQARALGFNYKEGQPFRPDDDGDDKDVPQTELVIRKMSEAEEADLREAGDRELDQYNVEEDE